MRAFLSRSSFPFYFLLAAFPFIAFWQIGLMQQVMKWDMLDQFFPYRYFLSECIHAGVSPAWNPEQHLGWPFHADPQSGFWYPVAWLIALFHGYDIYAINFEFVLHLCFAGTGFFILLKGLGVESKSALLFSFAYQCCGVFVNNAQHLTWIVAFAWLPFVVHCYFRLLAERKMKYAVAAALFMMLMLTGGYPIFFVITCYFLLTVFILHIVQSLKERDTAQLTRLIALHLSLAIFLIILSSGYLLSFREALPYISRGAGLTAEKAAEGALPLKALISFLFPFAVTKNEGVFSTDLSMLNVYMGLVPLLIALAGIFYFKIFNVRLFSIFGMICLLASLGSVTPVRGLLYHYLPAMDMFRFPSIFRAFFIFSFLIVAAITFQKSLEQWSKMRKYILAITILLALAAIGSHFFVLGKAEHFVKFPSLIHVSDYLAFFDRSNLQQRIAIQSLVQFFLLLLLIIALMRIKKITRLSAVILCITVADLFLSVQFNIPATAFSEVKTESFQSHLNKMPEGFPVPVAQAVADVPVYDKGFFPSWHNQNIFTKQPTSQGFNSFQLTAFAKFYDSPQRDSVLKHPLVYPEPARQNQVIALKKFQPADVEIFVSTDTSVRLTFLQSAYPGWQTTLDEKPVRLEKTELPFLTVAVPKGEHRVSFRYLPAYLIPCMLVSAISFLLAAACLVFACFKSLRLRAPHAAPGASSLF